ncbi:MAG: bifunctional [glutamate--ammonia ligase]-adenylyl-L-tyrosine phosphorylase/[glutamate--ammonia-ligase] adenylyltransferase [Deltaproteobacteria bacterium]|nr:bifunctional [glutamate--ammonia ligase]-adenylyl-L-tyrosine phosphorylase/[glutamate--ammonia-ligase] adenylyltransferase [Deltaproteobacteria bacterium]
MADALDFHELADLELAQRREKLVLLLDARGVAESRRVAEALARLLELPIFIIAADRVIAHLARTGSPARAMLALENAVQTLEARRGDASPLLVDPILRLVLELGGSSGRAARLLATDPTLAVELGARFDPWHQAPPFTPAIERILTAAGDDTEVFDRLLRRFRHRQMLRIALRELRGADVRATSAELAELASAALQGALAHHQAVLTARHGPPAPECAFVVIGMGKLGGRELNFSSDIDVIYLYEHDSGGAGELSMHQLAVKLFERVTASLSRVTEHGFVFRVDCDLRPEGKRGPLANSLASAERYYQTFGRTWERAAWTRARPVAGSERLGEQVMEMIRPFVWRKAFDLKAIEEIAAMKEKIDAARRRAAIGSVERGLDLKLGSGGIREIEFFVQAHQLLHGGKSPRLRHPSTLEALARLEAAGLVSARVRERLGDAYLLLRQVEHRLQIVEEQQTHTVPEDPEAGAALARSLELPDAASLMAELHQKMAEVHEVFSGLLRTAADAEPIPDVVALILDPELEAEKRLELLSAQEVRDPYAALANLEAAARPPGSPFHPRASPDRQEIGRRFLFDCWQSPNFERALRHLPELVRAVSVHTALIEELRRPALRRGVARVLGASDLLARILVTSPALLPSVLVGETATPPPGLAAELEQRLVAARGDVELAMAVLRNLKQEEVLRTAMADMAGLVDVDGVGERLSSVASVLVGAALDLALRTMTERFGEPRRADGGAAAVAVVAGGSAGAKEMGYRSDLDLMVIFEGDGETTGGRRGVVGTPELFARAAQRLVEFLTLRTPQGALYATDMRLRPSGTQGPLVVSLKNFESYHQRSAQLWERQALVRMRTIAGDPTLAARVDRAIHHAAYEPDLAPDARQKIHEMRLKLAKERAVRGATGAPVLDLKLGAGGLVEVEFLVQHLLLAHGRERPEIRTTHTRDALLRLGEAGLLAPRTVEALRRATAFLRRVQNWLRIERDEAIDHVELDPARLRPLALSVGYEGAEAERHFLRDLEAETGLIHRVYLGLMARGEGSG